MSVPGSSLVAPRQVKTEKPGRVGSRAAETRGFGSSRDLPTSESQRIARSPFIRALWRSLRCLVATTTPVVVRVPAWRVGVGWSLSGGCRGPEARGGAQRAREWAPEAARPPAPAISEPRCGLDSRLLRATPQPPTEPPSTSRHRHTPHAGFLALELVSPAPLLGLVDGLPADSECVSDLGPGSAVAACCAGQQIAYIGQGVLGVSHLLQSVQRPLRAAQGPRQVLDHPAGPQPRMTALFGAHVNGYWQRPRTPECTAASISVDLLIGANCCKQSISGKEVNGAPSGDISTPGDYVRPRDPIFGSIQPKKETPQERQLLGVVDDIRGN